MFIINQIVLVFLTISALFSPAIILALSVEGGVAMGLEPTSAGAAGFAPRLSELCFP